MSSIVDNELVGFGASDDGQFHHYINVPFGQRLEEIILDNINRFGDSTWMTNFPNGKSKTYSQLADGMRRVASWLRVRGLGPSEPVMIFANNYVDTCLFYFGVFKSGACAVPLNIKLTAEEVKAQMKEMGAKFILGDDITAGRILEAVEGLEDVRVIIIGQTEGDRVTSIDQLLEEEEKELPQISLDLDSPAVLLYSSGTTGTPKVIVHTHRTLTQVLLIRENLRNPAIVGRKGVFTTLMTYSSGFSACVVCTTNHESTFTFPIPTMELLMKSIDEIKPVALGMYPFEIVDIINYANKEQYDLSSVESISYFGYQMFPRHEKAIFNVFPNLLNLIDLYAISETLLLCAPTPRPKPANNAATREEVFAGHVVGSVGKVAPFLRLKIIDTVSGEKQGPNQVGEIIVKSPFVMKGYFNNPEETAKCIRQGWFYTGDQGYYDSAGNVFVVGRLKEIIRYTVYDVTPHHIEKQIMLNPAVKEVAVVGVPHERDCQHLLAFVVLKDGEKERGVTEEEIVQFANGKLEEAHKLRAGVRFLDSLPRTVVGKVLRRQLLKELPSLA